MIRWLTAGFLIVTWPAHADGIAGRFDFYLLALDWVPRNCPSDDPAAEKCQDGDHGFEFHTLWPRLDAGTEPTACLTMFPPELTPATFAGMGDLIPMTLGSAEWGLHGICSGLRVSDYFDLTHRAIVGLTIPADFIRPNFAARLTPQQISTDFVAVNPGLSPAAIAVQCRRGEFTGVKLCLGKDLEYRACEQVQATACIGESIAIPAVR
jgi:ribonuclease T2